MIVTVTLNPAIDKLYQVDHYQRGAVTRVIHVSNTAGGKGLNVARVASIWGAETLCLGFAGGYNGQFLRDGLRASGLQEKFTETEGETRCCINIREESTGVHTEFLEPGVYVGNREKTEFEATFDQALKQADVVTLSGSLPKGLSPDYYGELITKCRRADVPVLLDTSGEALRLGVEACPDLIKPNGDELATLLGHAFQMEELPEAAETLRNRGIGQVAMSLGSKGCLYCREEGLLRAVPTPIQTVNTVGCGDSMLAGFAIGFLKNLPAEQTLRLATALSEANALTEQTGFYEKESFEQVYDQIRIQWVTKYKEERI